MGEVARLIEEEKAVVIIDSLVEPEQKYDHGANRREGKRIIEQVLLHEYFDGVKNVTVKWNGVGNPFDDYSFYYPDYSGMATNTDGLVGVVQGIRSFDEDVLVSLVEGVDGPTVFERWNTNEAMRLLNNTGSFPVVVKDLNCQIQLSEEEARAYAESGIIPRYNVVDLEDEGVVHSKSHLQDLMVI